MFECGDVKGVELISSFKELVELDLDSSVLVEVEFCVPERTCSLKLLICRSQDSLERVAVVLHLAGVASSFATLDMLNLARDERYGNVQNCRVDVSRRSVSICLKDGLIEVVAESVSMVGD